VKAWCVFVNAALIALASSKAWAGPVRCASGPVVAYQNAPCPAGYAASAISGSFSVVGAETPRSNLSEDKLGMAGKPATRTKTRRDPANVREFRSLYPCPSTLEDRGPCPGWVVDHKIALACGGADAYFNMQWQTKDDAKAKDRIELLCGR
jgi:hypothetical protein